MKNKLEIGDEVLIFRYIPSRGPNQNYRDYLKGKVVSSELSEDISYHGSAQYVNNYTVVDEDGKKHYGNYYTPYLGDSFFMTKEDYIDYLEDILLSNNCKIQVIKVENTRIKTLLSFLKSEKENQEVVCKKRNRSK